MVKDIALKFFISNISTYNHDLGVKGHRLRSLMLKILH